jgi:hypothetical protein
VSCGSATWVSAPASPRPPSPANLGVGAPLAIPAGHANAPRLRSPCHRRQKLLPSHADPSSQIRIRLRLRSLQRDAREQQPHGLPILSTSNPMPPTQAIPSAATATATSVAPLYHLCLSICGLRTAPTLTPPSSPLLPAQRRRACAIPSNGCAAASAARLVATNPAQPCIWSSQCGDMVYPPDDEDGAWMAREDLHWTYSAPLHVYRGRAHGANEYKIIRYASNHLANDRTSPHPHLHDP